MTCIYCRNDKPESAFNTEHVLPRSLGTFNNNITLKSVCRDCNQRFGDTLDVLLGRSSMEALLRFLSGVKDITRIDELSYSNLVVTYDGEGPWNGALLKVTTENDEMVADLLPQAGLDFISKGKTFLLLDQLQSIEGNLKEQLSPKGKIHLLYRNDEEKSSLLQELKRIGVSFEEKGEEPFIDVKSIGGPNLSISYSKVDLIRRGISKIAFEYLSSQMGHSFVLTSNFDAIRNFILRGQNPNYPFFLGTHPDVDLTQGGQSKTSRSHVILLEWGSDLRSIIAYIELFGVTRYKIILTNNYKGLFRTDIPKGHYFDLDRRMIVEMKKGRIVLP